MRLGIYGTIDLCLPLTFKGVEIQLTFVSDSVTVTSQERVLSQFTENFYHDEFTSDVAPPKDPPPPPPKMISGDFDNLSLNMTELTQQLERWNIKVQGLTAKTACWFNVFAWHKFLENMRKRK